MLGRPVPEGDCRENFRENWSKLHPLTEELLVKFANKVDTPEIDWPNLEYKELVGEECDELVKCLYQKLLYGDAILTSGKVGGKIIYGVVNAFAVFKKENYQRKFYGTFNKVTG